MCWICILNIKIIDPFKVYGNIKINLDDNCKFLDKMFFEVIMVATRYGMSAHLRTAFVNPLLPVSDSVLPVERTCLGVWDLRLGMMIMP